MVFAAVAFADNVQNDVATVGGVKLVTVTAGGAGATVTYNIHETSGDSTDTGGQDAQRCNAADGTAATVTPSGMPTGVTADPTSVTFTDCDSALGIEFTAGAGTVPGDYPISVGISDAGADMTAPGLDYNTSPADFTLRVVAATSSNSPPAIDSFEVTGNCQPTANFTFTDSDAGDSHSGSVDWSKGFGPVESALLIGPGEFEATKADPYSGNVGDSFTVEATVDDGEDSDTAEVTHTLKADAGSVLQPINADGSSVFKIKSTIPVKVKPVDCDGDAVPGLAPSLSLNKVDSTTNNDGAIETVTSTSGADSGSVMRWSADDEQYIYNLATKGKSAGTYRLRISEGDFAETVVVDFDLR